MDTLVWARWGRISSSESMASIDAEMFDTIGARDESSRIAPRASTLFQKTGDGLRCRDSHWYTTALFRTRGG